MTPLRDDGLVVPAGYDRRSGLHVAAVAHQQGAVQPAEPVRTFEVTVSFVAAGDPLEIRAGVETMTAQMAMIPGVSHVTESITEREVPS